MSYRIIKVTPSLAEKYLVLNTKNRFLRKAHVSYLVELILNGEWRRTGEPIRFSGKLDENNIPIKGNDPRNGIRSTLRRCVC